MTTHETSRWSWKQEPELMARLTNVQNTDRQMHQDIMTIVGFFTSRQQLEAHVVRYETTR